MGKPTLVPILASRRKGDDGGRILPQGGFFWGRLVKERVWAISVEPQDVNTFGRMFESGLNKITGLEDQTSDRLSLFKGNTRVTSNKFDMRRKSSPSRRRRRVRPVLDTAKSEQRWTGPMPKTAWRRRKTM